MHDSEPTAVILAAGEGQRLRPLTNRRPKPMLPVAGKPILEYVIEAVAEAGISDIVLVVGYRQERIRTHFGDGTHWGLDIGYVEQRRQLGTGHALLQATEKIAEPFLMLNGDRIVDASLIDMVNQALTGETQTPVISMTAVETPREYGVIQLDDADRATGIEEKPERRIDTSLINAGVYGFQPAIFEAIRDTSTSGELELTATLSEMALESPLETIEYTGEWLDVSHLWDLVEANASLVDERAHDDFDTTTHIAADVCIDPGVQCGPGAVIEGGTSVGANVSIGSNVTIANSVILPDAVIQSGSVIEDSVIGSNVSIGANTTIEGGETTVTVGESLHSEIELGAVIGDNAEIGAGVTLESGTVVGTTAVIDAGVGTGGRIGDDAYIRRA